MLSTTSYGYVKRSKRLELPVTKLPNGITMEIRAINPDDAASFLAHRRPEHRVLPQAVKAYAAAMKAGSWVLNGMPIIFGADGSLLDGVQRLKACVDAGVSFETVVAQNVDEATLHTIDQHRRRSYQGVLESRGERDPGSLMRLMSKMIRYEDGVLGTNRYSISWVRYDRVLEANPLLREAVELSNNSRVTLMHPAARNPLIYMALAAGHRAELQRLLAALLHVQDRVHLDPGGLLALQLQMDREQGGQLSPEEILAMGIMALNDMVSANTRKTYVWRPSYGTVPVDAAGRPTDPRRVSAEAPRNLGMPWLTGYPGLKNASFEKALAEGFAPAPAVARTETGAVDEQAYPIRFLTLEPDVARDWLNRYNVGNRRILATHVRTIARDIKAGNWMLNAQPICFSASGRLLNGQHRLLGCVEAEMPIDVVVMQGLAEEAFATYDIHARKTPRFGETIKSTASADPRVIAAAAKLLWRIESNVDPLASSKPSSSEIKAVLERHPELPAAFPTGRKLQHLVRAAIGTFVVYWVRQDNPAIADDFIEGLVSGAGLDADNPILKVRNKLMIDRRQPGALERRDMYQLLMDAWGAYKAYRNPEGPKTARRGTPG
jgi:hypothetical protein